MKSRIVWLSILLRDFVLFPLAYAFPRNKKKYLCGAWWGRNFSDNPKYFMLYLLDNTDAECVWIGNENLRTKVEALGYPKSHLKFVRKGSLLSYWHFITAGNFMCNINWRGEILDLPSSSRVKIYNLWHGTALKNLCGEPNEKHLGYCRIRRLAHDILVWWSAFLYPQKSYTSVASEHAAEELVRSHPNRFARERMIFEGYSRIDYLLSGMKSKDVMDGVKKKYAGLLNLPTDKRWYLYLPTFRDWTDEVFSFSTMSADQKERLNKILNEQNAIIIEKQHPRILHRIHPSCETQGSVRMVSEEEGAQIDLQELMLASDRMITDYSSCYFDFACMDRAVIHFAYDEEEYAGKRGLVYKLSDVLAGPNAITPEELVSLIEKDDAYLIERRGPRFKDTVICEHGHASESLYKAFASV